ncbi:Hypothetical predicted protein [Paramuricea clavata]|uniref:Uncharacterized protein n=1 Tax=Paramuricea clavata TaxID=317549 RepID=A0A7D9EMY7_PARCT|nr:Hypothetical predicted protein [Paramuricea clavata]
MGCGASKIVEQQAALNNNGHAQEIVRKSSVVEKLTEQNEPVSTPPEKQAQPVQQKAPEPEKRVSTATSPEPKSVAAEPVQEEPKKDEPSNEKPAPTYTEESLQDVLELEKKLSLLESKGVVGQYQTQHKLLVSLYPELQAAQKKVEALKQQTVKEYRDVAVMQHPNVRAMFSDVYQLQSQMAKEQQEYMDALNRQEVAEKELKSRQEEYNALYAEVESLQKECEELQRIRAEREKKLDEIFDGKYGSDLEGQLEAETDLLTERKEIISRARNYWSNAKVLMEHAVQQLAYSTRRWAQINTVNQSMVQARYSMVAETRNYLIAASQNITNTHRYLSNVNIPYCNSEDLRVLNNAIATIFNDIMNRDSYMRALQTYSALNNKANSLHQWIILVLEKTINKDLQQIVPLWQEKILALKRERMRLIHVKLRELQGKDVSEDIPDEVLWLQHSQEQIPEVQSDTRIAEPDTVSLKDDNLEDIPSPPTTERRPSHEKDVSSEGDSLPTTEGVAPSDTPPSSTTQGEVAPPSEGDIPPPLTTQGDVPPSFTTEKDAEDTKKANGTTEESSGVDSQEIAELLETAMKVKPLIELAPVPNMDALFGNIEELKTKYEEQVAQFSKAQDVNKARLDQALQEKLQARRIRKQAIELQDTSELAKGVTSSFGKLF